MLTARIIPGGVAWSMAEDLAAPCEPLPELTNAVRAPGHGKPAQLGTRRVVLRQRRRADRRERRRRRGHRASGFLASMRRIATSSSGGQSGPRSRIGGAALDWACIT